MGMMLAVLLGMLMRRSILVLSLLTVACAPSALDEAADETGLMAPLDIVPDDGKYDGTAARGPRVGAGVSTEVWSVTNAWSDRDTEAARVAGIAWDADSGLSWEEKFDRWIAAFEREARHQGSGDTFVITTPYGARRFHAPTLECAEVAYLLRATFASWYHLPFYVQGWDAHSRQTMYAGHFGFVNARGERVGRFPSFRTAYADHEANWQEGEDWPSDARLRGYRLGDDDAIDFLSSEGEEVGAGAYLDALFLNKRAGYFMRLLLLYFGSANLADGANTFHVQAEAVEAGDVLLHRWQKRGIGHVMPVFQVTRHSEEALEVSIASGSMPRREPVWEEPTRARHHFTSDYAGGVGESSDGDAYAALGGGVRRWRTAVLRSGRWRNEVSQTDREAYINDRDYAAIEARPGRYDEILRSLSPQERRDVALAHIEAAREHLRRYPASCAARRRREDAFEQLYAVMEESDALARSAVDAQYRTLEDDVFGELVYEVSRTCCWNRSNAAMYDVIMDYARVEQAEAEDLGMCLAPTVFRAERDGYARWQAHAVSMGRSGDWRAWSEDESCAQRDVSEDTVGTRVGSDFCGRNTAPSEPAEMGNACDPDGVSNDAQQNARTLVLGQVEDGEICNGDVDWFYIDDSGELEVVIAFDHDAGDLDVQAVDAEGRELARSASVQHRESIVLEGPFYLRVYGYRDAANTYTISVR